MYVYSKAVGVSEYKKITEFFTNRFIWITTVNTQKGFSYLKELWWTLQSHNWVTTFNFTHKIRFFSTGFENENWYVLQDLILRCALFDINNI